MKLVLTLLFLLPLTLLAQIKFSKGYIITNQNERQECLLKNIGIDGSGSNYIYKFSEKGEEFPASIEAIKEFGRGNHERFIREYISVDISGNTIKSLKDTLGHEQLQEGHVFLTELVASEAASLYYFYYEGSEYFFYKVGKSKINQLHYKRYELQIASGLSDKVLYDNRYQKQLEKNMQSSLNAKRVSYAKKPLIKYFQSYITEQGSVQENVKMLSKGKFNIKLVGSYNKSSYEMTDGDLTYLDFGSEQKFSYGLKLEYFFPFNRNKFGIFTELNYMDYASELINPVNNLSSSINYEYFEIPIGVQYNFNLTEQAKLYVNGGISPNMVLDDSLLTLYNKSNTKDLKSATNLFFSVGGAYKRISLELRFSGERNITQNLYKKPSKLSHLAIRVAYDIVKL